MKFLKRLFQIVLILILLIAAFLFYTVRHSFPQTSGDLQISGLNKPVTVYRDRLGIPQIYADNTHDLFFAQGYVHAQDRFWQMDVWRHIGAGRLSEMFGKSQLRTDRFLRTLGWKRVAEQGINSMDPTSLSILKAYCDGVNAYLADHHGTALSLEYGVLRLANRGYKLEPWKPVDAMTWGVAMAWDLGGNMDDEMIRAELLNTMTPEQVEALYPPYPKDDPVILPHYGSILPEPPTAQRQKPPVAMLTALSEARTNADSLLPLLGENGAGVGSNNWVISGKRTASGKPVLCNDPHLGIQMPSIWYEVGLHCSVQNEACPYEVTGFSFAGVPGIIIGHNNRIAWGFTNVGPDVQDLYIEKINPQNRNQYEVNGKWVDMKLVQETVRISDGSTDPVTVRYTRHGPIISDDYRPVQAVHKSTTATFPDPFAISLRWTALELPDVFPAIWRMNQARNWQEFREAASHFDVPSQNMVYADVDGNIGYQMPGKIPIRAHGDGRYPVPGWTDEYEWTGYIPFEQLPFRLNPEEGFIASANNPVISADYAGVITADWEYGFRARRIVEMITGAKGSLTIQQIAAMQGDAKDLNAEKIVPHLMELQFKESNLQNAQQMLRNWDFQNSMDSAPSAVYETFWKHLLADTLDDDLPEDHQASGGSRTSQIMRQLIDDPENPWWDNKKTSSMERRDDILKTAFSEAVHELETTLGSASNWKWGALHTATFRNGTFGKSNVALLEKIFNRGPFPVSGGSTMVNATFWHADQSFDVTDLPSMRMVVDLSNLSNSRSVLTTGESGHAYHPHYYDMTDLWRNIQYHPMLWDPSQIQQNATATLRLMP